MNQSNHTNLPNHSADNVPELRFKIYDDVWQLRKLKEMLVFKNGINAKKEDYGRGYKFINVLDIIENDFITYSKIKGSVNVTEEIFKKNQVEYGDILFQRSSETREEVGQANVYLDKDHLVTFGGFVIRGKKIAPYNPFFFNSLLKTAQARKEITSKSGGSTRFNVSQGILSEVVLYFPSLPEQQKIANFLTTTDKKIQVLTRKVDLLKTYKKGVMQKIFKQEIRFRKEDGREFGDWQMVRANQIFKSHSNKNHNGELPILAVTQDEGVVRRDSIEKQIMSSEASVKSYKIIEKGDFVISLRSFQGGIEYSYIEGICSPAYTVLKSIIELNDVFYKYYMKKESFISRLSATVVGIRDGKQISFSAFSGMKLIYPLQEEQTKIANFLTSIDKKIKATESQLAKMKSWKKSLLQQMFV